MLTIPTPVLVDADAQLNPPSATAERPMQVELTPILIDGAPLDAATRSRLSLDDAIAGAFLLGAGGGAFARGPVPEAQQPGQPANHAAQSTAAEPWKPYFNSREEFEAAKQRQVVNQPGATEQTPEPLPRAKGLRAASGD